MSNDAQGVTTDEGSIVDRASTSFNDGGWPVMSNGEQRRMRDKCDSHDTNPSAGNECGS